MRRTESEITMELAAARERYHAGSRDMKATEAEGLSAQIGKLKAELSALYSANAKPCPGCGAAPIGMLRCAGYQDRGREVPALYEVGCVNCPPFETESGKRRSFSAQGLLPVIAVERWNAEQWVEDKKAS